MANRRGNMKTVADFIFLGSKITVDGDCSHEIKRRLLLGRKAVTNLDSVLKSRDITLLTKVRIVRFMIFPVVMYVCDSWIIKKTWALKNWFFGIVLERRFLRVPWTGRRWSQSIVKEINPEYSLQGMMLKLKLQYFLAIWCGELTCWKRAWCWKRLKTEEKGVVEGWDGWMASPTQWTWIWANPGRWWTPGMPLSMGSQRVSHDLATE